MITPVHHRAVVRLVNGSRRSNTTTTHIRYLKMDSSTESILGEIYYIKQIKSEVKTIDTINEIDVNPYVRTS